MRKVLFLDRDGVINKDVSYLYKISDLEWVDGAKEALQRLTGMPVKACYIYSFRLHDAIIID